MVHKAERGLFELRQGRALHVASPQVGGSVLVAAVEGLTAERLEQHLHTFVEAQGIKPADIVHAIRVAVTGKAVGFGLFDTLAILGRERSVARIDRALTLTAP